MILLLLLLRYITSDHFHKPYLATEAEGDLLEAVDKKQEVFGLFTEEEKDVLFYFTAKNLLCGFLSEFHHQRKPMCSDKLGDQRRANLSAELCTTLVILKAHNN